MPSDRQNYPALAADAVLASSADIRAIVDDQIAVHGPDFDDGSDPLHSVIRAFRRTGFQATHLGLAIDEINRMRHARHNEGCLIFLAFTSNMISSGVREVIRYLVRHKMVDVVVTTAGGIEEDLIKCLKPTYVGDFSLEGANLRRKGVNRIGNLLIPNDNYVAFEEWLFPILEACADEATQNARPWTPSKLIHRLGQEINDPASVYYWCAQNNIPVFSPALTDGSIGDMLYFHSYKRDDFVLDIVGDIRRINDIAVRAPAKTGIIVLGGGLVKHHVCNANLMRNGADFAVFINTGQEFDGSDSGARPDEAVSWGKIKIDAQPVKVYADATIVFPIIVAATFASEPTEPQE